MTRTSELIDRGERPTFDYVVVGAGPAGCAVAARLAQSSPETSVALIEAGPAKASLLSDVPVGVAALVPYRSRGTVKANKHRRFSASNPAERVGNS